MRRCIQFAAAPDAVRDRTGRSLARGRYRTGRRFAGRREFTRPPHRRIVLEAAWIESISRADAFRSRRPCDGPSVSLRHRPGDGDPLRLACFHQDRPKLPVPDVEFMFRGAPLGAGIWFPGIRPPYEDGFGILPAVLHPKSRGVVRLRSADPRDPVRISYRFFSHPDDLPKLRLGFKLARELAAQKALEPFRAVETRPGPDIKSDEEIDAWIRATAETVSHPLCTCPMGTDEAAVLDPEFRVRGIEALRVVDGSAMPDIVSAHPNAGIIMMAERASDMIRGRLQKTIGDRPVTSRL